MMPHPNPLHRRAWARTGSTLEKRGAALAASHAVSKRERFLAGQAERNRAEVAAIERRIASAVARDPAPSASDSRDVAAARRSRSSS